MRPEDITEQDENEKIKETEGQSAADENQNGTVKTEASQETHSEYKICRVCTRIGFSILLPM